MSIRYPPEEIVPALVHRNRHVRRYAALMLGIGGDDRLVPFLADLLRSGSAPEQRAAARALGTPVRPFSDSAWPGWSGFAVVGREAVESLTAALGDSDVIVRAHSARSLGKLRRQANAAQRLRDETTLAVLRSDAAIVPLIQALRDPTSQVRAQAAEALREFSAPAALPALLSMLQDPDEEVRSAAALASGDLGAPESLPVLLENLRHGSRGQRQQAAVSLRYLENTAVVAALMEALGDPNRAVQSEAAISLGHLGDPQAVPALIDAMGASNIMDEERRGLRENLVNALGSMGDRRAVPALVRALDDYDKHVRDAGLLALAKLGGSQAEDALINLVDECMSLAGHYGSVRPAIRGLGRMGAVRAMPVLRLVIEDGRRELAPVAALALRQLGDAITAGDMLAWLSSSNSERRLRAVLTLPALVDQDAVPYLLNALVDHDPGVRAAAARQLGSLGDESLIPILADALRDEVESEDVRDAIRSALASLTRRHELQAPRPEAG